MENETFFDGAPFCCAVLDNAGRIRMANGRMAEVLGESAEALAGTELSAYLEPEDAAILREHLSATPEQCTLRLRGRAATLSCTLAPGAAAGMHYLWAEMAPAARASEEARLRVLNRIANRLEFGADDGVAQALETAAQYLGMDLAIISHIDGDLYRVQHCWSCDHSLTPDDIFPLGETYCSITLENEGVTAIDEMSTSHHRGHPCYAAFQLESYIGTCLWVDDALYGTLNFSRRKTRKVPWKEADLAFVRIMAQWVGHSLKRIDTEQALAAGERRFRTLLQSAPVGIYITDAEGNCVMVNERWQQITGFTQEDALGEGWAQALHPDDQEAVFAEWQCAAKENREFAMEFRWRRPDGSVVWSSSSARPLHDDAGTLEGFMGTVTDISDRKHYELSLERQARVDELTGLPNRRAFERALHNEIARAMRYGNPLSLLLIDLDHFKSVNDTYGHETGDQVLRAVGYAVDASVRVADTPARYGGEEFAVLLPQTRRDEAAAFGERLRQRLSRLAHKTPKGDAIQVTSSMGVAEFDVDYPDERRVVKAADEALYEAKAAGRNCLRAAK